MNTEEKRIHWIDNIKFLGMILVVIGHCIPYNSILSKYIYSFHMPLFFFLSGIVYDSKKYKNLKEIGRKKAKSILIPYFTFSIITYVFWILISSRFTKSSVNVNPLQPLIGIFYSNAIGNWMIYDGPLWFLTCLFLTEIEFYFINKLSNGNTKKTIFILGLICIIAVIDGRYMTFRLPWSFDISLTAVVFYGCGFIFKNKIKKLQKFICNKKINMFICVPFLMTNVIFCILNRHIEMNYGLYGNTIYFYISSLSGIIFYSITFMVFVNYKNKFFGYIGRNTIIILSLHLVFINCIRGLVYFIFKIPMQLLTNNLYIGLLLVVICGFSFIPICYIVNRYAPFIIGKSSKNVA
ncbi:Fucose 4-O-acetylase [Clostridium acidisoli DSM 12555]|uniref:Fucose 4-O-acetylase n=1 Tax=Clostridium acidisoli DSM 12555 TaxID=1121291 RepID=A0A1W1Y070_9CLOT|nr:acyltransferase family protein [Clostridium acidisoli]SMC29138.1 Fucose 4-O-acetylase [Clostridium acidisoli DSM 12555]